MKMRLVLVLASALVIPGCIHHHRPHVMAPPAPHVVPARVVVVPAHHVCHAGCGHYYRGNTVYYAENHAHGPGCGHLLRGGIWIHAD